MKKIPIIMLLVSMQFTFRTPSLSPHTTQRGLISRWSDGFHRQRLQYTPQAHPCFTSRCFPLPNLALCACRERWLCAIASEQLWLWMTTSGDTNARPRLAQAWALVCSGKGVHSSAWWVAATCRRYEQQGSRVTVTAGDLDGARGHKWP